MTLFSKSEKPLIPPTRQTEPEMNDMFLDSRIPEIGRGIGCSRWREIAIIILWPLLALLIAVACKPLFGTNDDAALAMVGAGFGIAVQPDPHLLFAHYGYGLLLNLASSLIGQTAHGVITLGALCLSLCLVTRSVMCGRSDSIVVKTLFLFVASASVFAYALLSPQFTITSAVLVSSGLSGRLLTIWQSDRKPAAIADYVAIILGFLIRPISAMMVLLIASPALIGLLISGSGGHRARLGRFLAVIIGIACLMYASDWIAYALSAAWSQAREYNYIRALFSDFQRIAWQPHSPAFKAVGWSENDYRMFMAFYTVDPIFSLKNISYLADKIAISSPLFVTREIPRWLQYPVESPVLGAMLAIQAFQCMFLKGHRIAILLIAGEVLVIFLSALSGRPPQSGVWFASADATLIGLFTLTAFQGCDAAKSQIGRYFRAFCAVLIVTLAISVGVQSSVRHLGEVERAQQYRTALLKGERFFHGEAVVWGGSLIWQWLVTPTGVYKPVSNRILIGLGVFANTPVGKAVRLRMGVSNLSRTICTDKRTKLIAQPLIVKYVERFCAEHYQIRPGFAPVFKAGSTQVFAPAAAKPVATFKPR